MNAMLSVKPAGGCTLPAQVSRANWGETMVDAQLWQPVVRAICSAIGLSLGDELAAGYPGSSAVFVVAEQAVVKLFPPFFARDFVVESAVYEMLNGRVTAMPRLLARGTYHDRIDWPFLVLSYRDGEPIRGLFSRLNEEQKTKIARQAGHLLRTVHQTPLAGQTLFPPWSDFLAERAQKCLTELREKTPLTAATLAEIEAFIAEMVPQLAQETAVLLNADLTDDHVLLCEERGTWRIEAIIDWADAEVAHPAYEWVAAWFGFCRRDVNMFKSLVKAYRPQQSFDASFRRELLACTFLHRFGALIVSESWQANPLRDNSLRGLQNWLWPLDLELDHSSSNQGQIVS